jgi:hypothetical protein
VFALALGRTCELMSVDWAWNDFFESCWQGSNLLAARFNSSGLPSP